MGTPWAIADVPSTSVGQSELCWGFAYLQYQQAAFTAVWPGASAAAQREQQEHQMSAHPPGLPTNSCSPIPTKALPCALNTCWAQHLQPPGTYSWHRFCFHMDQWREKETGHRRLVTVGIPCCEVSEQDC